MERGGVRVYVSLAQAIANPDETDNPLLKLVNEVKAQNGVAAAIDELLETASLERAGSFLSQVLDELGSITGGDVLALAVLVDWSLNRLLSLKIPRRCLRPITAVLSKIPAEIHAQAIRYLEAESSKKAVPLPFRQDEVYDIPAFLRRMAA